MWLSYIFAICWLQIVSNISASSHYTVIGPGTIHSEHKYTVAVAVHDTTEPCQIKVGITGPTYKEHKLVDLNTADEVKLVNFDVPELGNNDYNLTAEGIMGIKFYNTTKLNFAKFEPKILIQTDKGAYKPDDVVQFRVVFLDENLKPFTIKPTTFIWFEDSKRNRIKEFRNLHLVRGVYTGSFQISQFAILGTWRIIVQTQDDDQTGSAGKSTVYFDVEKYVLPKYVANAESTEYVSVLDGDMQVVVRANYTFGKPVNGKVTLIGEVNSWYENIGNISRIIKAADMVNGKAKFDFSVHDYNGQIGKKHAVSLDILATVEEEFTGVKINATTQTTLYPYRYHIRCADWDTCSTYHADQEQEVLYKILHIDNSLVEDTKTVVRLIYTEYTQESWERQEKREKGETVADVTLPQKLQTFVFESHLNASSIATFKVTLPDLPDIEGYYHQFETEVEFSEQSETFSRTDPYRKPKNVYIPPPPREEPKDYFKIKTVYAKDTYNFKLGQEASFVVNSSVPFNYFVYTIVGRGNVLKVERVELPVPAKTYELKFLPSLLMARSAKLYIHYVENDVYHYAETHFGVEYEFENKIDISVPEQVKVGENVPLHISTAPNSFVGLLGVDQSVLLHKENNDLHDRNLIWSLSHYSTHTSPQGGYSTYPGGASGVVTLTNANYFYNWTKPSWNDHPLMWNEFSLARGASRKAVHKSAHFADDSEPSQSPSASPSNPTVRKNFAETWIFDNIESTAGENITWSKTIPDTITSWVITGFSLNAEKGFATTKAKSYVKTFQPFFVSIRLPYSVKRDEIISIPALVFNYLEKDLDVEVTLDNTDGEFEFTEVTNEVIDVPIRSKILRVPADSSRGVSFMIRPKTIGNILLKIKAVSALAGDAIHKSLKVVPEGITEYANRAYFVNLQNTGELKETFEIEYPEEIVPDSDYAEFSIVGDTLGPIFNNLGSLVRMPTGCGEQTMSTFVTNYLALRYLKSIDRLTPVLETRIKNNLEHGYQNMLSFRHKDGSFSSFGPGFTHDNRPRNGSTWLTAYVTRFLHEAQENLHLDKKIIDEGLSYLGQRQAANGSFSEEGGDCFFRSQSHEVSLTANVLLAFVIADDLPHYTKQTDDGFKFLLENIEKTIDLRAKALAIYTLKKANHELASTYLTDFKSLAKSDVDRMWWSAAEENVNKSPYFRWWRWPLSEAVEVTSYTLLSLLDEPTETVDSVLPIVKWLIAQRNSYGGFSSTQDTVMGLQALIKFVEKSGYEPAEMHVEFTTAGDGRTKHETLDTNKENAILMQSYELPAQTRTIEFQAKGTGAALVQVSYQYNVFEKEKSPTFTLKTEINKATPGHKLELDVCVEYVGTDSESNMALLEVSLPSGYVADEESFEELRKVERVRHIELKKSGTNIVLYFESLRKDDVKCLLIEAFKSFAVALQKPAPIVVYDYYDTTKRASTNYEVSSKLCDICDRDEEECLKVCG